MNCHCTASSFTDSLEPVGFVILGSLTPETQPYMMFLFVSSQFCTRASSPQFLADLQLPSASRYNLRYHSDEVGSPTEDFHLISSRPCWAYQGKFTRTVKSAAPSSLCFFPPVICDVRLIKLSTEFYEATIDSFI